MLLFNHKVVSLALVIAWCLCLGPVTASAGSNLVAEVGGIPVTVFELQREFQQMLPMQVGFHGGVPQEKLDQIQRQAFESLVDRAYKVRYALAEELTVEGAAIDERLAPIRARFADSAAFEKALGSEGLDGFRASLYRRLLAEKAEEVAVTGRIVVSDAQVRGYYDEHRATFMRPHQFKASHILIKVDPSSNKEERQLLRERAEALLQQARSGEDFYNLAYYNSDDRSKFVGGDLGYFHEGQTVPEFEAALKALQPGEVSEIIQTMYGYHIVKLVESNAPRQLTFDEVHEKIRKKLETSERDSLYAEWMASLRAQYPVKRFDP